MLFTRENIRRAGVDRLIFVDSDLSEENFRIVDVIRDREAVVLRFQEGGAQARATWFRAFFNSLNISYPFYNSEVGIPALPSATRGKLMLPENWGHLQGKKRVAKSLLDSLGKTNVGAHFFISMGEGQDVDEIRVRCMEIAEMLPAQTEVGIWSIQDFGSIDILESTLEKAWLRSFGQQCFGWSV